MLAVPHSLQRRALEVDGWLDLGCPDVALRKLEPLLANPGARSVGLRLRVRAFVELERFVDALADIESLRPLHHDPEWLDLTEAWCCKRTGRLPRAIACMERLIQREPANATAHFNLGCYLAIAGDKERALDMVTRACSLDATFRGAPLDDPDLDNLRLDAAFLRLRTD
ncbi:MAG: tetratricopeptide repeat protein [Planctomycetota bacterium]